MLYLKTMYINSKKLHEFSKTTFYRKKKMKEDFMSDFFSYANCMLVLFCNATHLTFLHILIYSLPNMNSSWALRLV